MPTSCPFKLLGYDHIKVAVEDVTSFESHLQALGFSPLGHVPSHLNSPLSAWGSGDAVFCIYKPDHPEAKYHYDLHGDTIFDLSFVVESLSKHPMQYEGVGKMKHTLVHKRSFPRVLAKRGILRFDHNTLNIERGKLNETVEHYQKTFGLNKGQYFDIKGKATGLYSWVTRASNFSVQIPFNEAADEKSQIQEYINVHRGPGVQHIAILTADIIQTMDQIRADLSSPIKFLDIPDTYYELIEKRFKIRESFSELKRLRLLADQDMQTRGYLLQIFTQNVFGGFFFELIQREGNQGFGEGNFTALFESIELDQKRRGVL